MDKESLQAELDSAYKSLDKAERQIKILLIERRQNQIILQMLEAAGFISEGKLQEAKEFVQAYYPG